METGLRSPAIQFAVERFLSTAGVTDRERTLAQAVGGARNADSRRSRAARRRSAGAQARSLNGHRPQTGPPCAISIPYGRCGEENLRGR